MYRVIIADDNPEFLKFLNSLLKTSNDFEILGEATASLEALYLVSLLLPDLLIVDVNMPDLDGLELARYLRHAFPNVKVIPVSAYQESDYEALRHNESSLDFIPKAKFSLDVLYQALQGER